MIVLYNPHVDDFLAQPPHFRLLKRRALKKYGFLISQALTLGEKINVLVDGSISAFIPQRYFRYLPSGLRKLIVNLELRHWVKLNNLTDKINFVNLADDVSEHVLLVFSYKACVGSFSPRQALFSRYKAVVFHLSHYFILTKEKSNNIALIENAYLAGDSDITGNVYFNKFFSWYKKPFLVLPFSVGSRFVSSKDFASRENRCVATGSFHDLYQEQPQDHYKDYIESTNLNTYHPLRKALYMHKETLTDRVECRVNPYRNYQRKNWLHKLIQKFRVSQKKYFAINIVDLYNSYKYVVVGEEYSGFPALGAFEAMACGTLLIAQLECYQGLGLKAMHNCVPYDGTQASLLEQLEKLRKMELEDLLRITHNGKQHVQSVFSEPAMYKKWVALLNELTV